MKVSAPALVPLFRSDQQMRILGAIFVLAVDEISIGDVAQRADVSQATASKEVARLEEHGLVVSRKIGRTKLVQPNWKLTWAPELRSILMQTIGVLGRLGVSLSGLDGIEEAYVFGSWAARYEGEVGPQPADIDVVVVGTASLGDVRGACRAIQEELRMDVNPIVVDSGRWELQDDPFITQIRNEPLVPITLEERCDE